MSEITVKATTLYCVKRKGHLGCHLNDSAWFESQEERAAFAKIAKVNKSDDVRWAILPEKASKTK